MKNPEKVLTEFYRDVQRALDMRPQDRPKWFRPNIALCSALTSWAEVKELGDQELELLQETQCTKFTKAGLNKLYPFDANAWEFLNAAENGLVWENPKRLAWVTQHSRKPEKKMKHRNHILAVALPIAVVLIYLLAGAAFADTGSEWRCGLSGAGQIAACEKK